MQLRLLSLMALLIFGSKLMSQNTVGTIVNTPQSFNGYTILCPTNSFQTYLIDNCGRVINSWNSNFQPGLSAYLLENGSLIRSGRVLNNNMSMGGIAGVIEKYSWDGFLEWRYRCSGPDSTSHHDFEVLPNGNVLLLVSYAKNINDAIGLGRDSSINADSVLFTESVIEIEPIGLDSGRIVWRWDLWNHLIQDRDSNKANFGVISEHPERLNINYIGSSTSRDWLHANSVDYNPELDQIVISLRNTNEFFVIDHSTTMAESAGSSGGRYGKGGDILYRWGNPAAYNRGTVSDQKFYGQHDVKWISAGLPGAGHFMVFNNGDITGISSVEEIAAVMDSAGFYSNPGTSAYGPAMPFWSHSDMSNPLFNSGRLSSADRMPNGNTLICSGYTGYLSEVDSIGNLVWAYRNPLSGTGIISQGSPVNNGTNSIFSARRYAPAYPALIGRDLTPGDPLELNFDLSGCQLYNSVINNEIEALSVYPNPASDFIYISSESALGSISVYNITGKLLFKTDALSNIAKIDISQLSAGIYLIKKEAETDKSMMFIKY